MERIFKYELDITDEQTVQIPGGGKKILSVAMQGGTTMTGGRLCVWVIVDDEAQPAPVRFAIVGTGNPFPRNVAPAWFIGSVQDDPFVWHVFEVQR